MLATIPIKVLQLEVGMVTLMVCDVAKPGIHHSAKNLEATRTQSSLIVHSKRRGRPFDKLLEGRLGGPVKGDARARGPLVVVDVVGLEDGVDC